MAGPTKAELAGSITERLQQLEAGLREFTAVTNVRLNSLELKAAERQRVDEAVQAKLAELAANDAGFSQTARMLEKLSDRSWGLTEKLYVTALSLICGGSITLVVQYALRR